MPDLLVPDLGLSLRDVHWVDLFVDDGLDRLVRALADGAGIAPAEHATNTGPVPPQVFRDIDSPWCPEMVVIPGGRFVMGSPPNEEGRNDNEGPQHFVTIAESFALGRYLVTFDEYDEFAATTGREPPGDEGWGRGRLPVINVSWDDAQAYVQWLSQQTGKSYRLPSEAEWEYACRASTTTPFHRGANISPRLANYTADTAWGTDAIRLGRKRTRPVGKFPANAFGLHDMHGNVLEWCADVWHDSYEGAPTDSTAWVEGGMQGCRVLRGGSWKSGPSSLRCAARAVSVRPNLAPGFVGFRVARTLR